MTPQQFLQILRVRYKLALIVFVATVAIATVVSLLQPKEYQASTSLVLDVKADPIAGMLMPGLGSPSNMATQIEIIQSDRVATRAVQLLHLDRAAFAIERWKEETDSRIPIENYWGGVLQKGLQVQPARGSNIISLSYKSQDAKFTAAVVNAFAQAYINVSIELHVEPARQYAAWFDDRLKVLRTGMEQAQTKLSAFQQEKGIVAADARADLESQRLNALIGQLASAQGDKADTMSRQKNTGTEFSPDVQQNPIVQSLKSELARAETRMSEISGNVGSNHPQRVQLQAQIDGIKGQLASEMHRISGGSVTATRVSAQREDELKAMVETQKQKVLALRENQDKLTVLLRDVESAQRAYDVVAQRMSQTTLESQSTQANVRVLSPAVEPLTPSGPKVMRNIMMAVLGGALLGAGLVIGIEFLDRRVRVIDDLVTPEAIPLLGVLRPGQTSIPLKERLIRIGDYFRTLRRRRTLQTAK
ncbi:MAG: chain length determinant protein EpsF [Rhodocyclaceae bacterium]|nr:MAG: chain length determinant protein EpsF [Rhodocyclaceae bacterium]TNC98426.1 MAG: chain length determinant protein EpsF [Rhodocyclaceae bacterium]